MGLDSDLRYLVRRRRVPAVVHDCSRGDISFALGEAHVFADMDGNQESPGNPRVSGTFSVWESVHGILLQYPSPRGR